MDMPQFVHCDRLTWIPRMTQVANVPSLETAREVISQSRNSQFPPNLLPVTASIPADLLTPTLAYLKLAEK